jgi:L-seryl-tRNA(Ser) seleniumtransferase
MSHDPQDSHSTSASDAEQERIRQLLRRLPSVEWLRQRAGRADTSIANIYEGSVKATDARVTQIAREVLNSARAAIRRGDPPATRDILVAAVQSRLLESRTPHLREVINATGVIIHTNLGRAPLSERAIQQMSAVARGYSNLEFDLAQGARGSRLAGIRQTLCDLTGAEDALVVNNNAAAVLLTLAALAADREVIVSRGELVEIGGGFRIPEVLAQSGARLVEVGTTNKTHLRDYAAAVTPATAAILSVHPSNFRIVGFTETPRLTQISALARETGVLHIHDLGSGAAFATEGWGLAHEPTVYESITAGADVICFSGDKLLGGPQAGVILGHHALLARIERHPLIRAVRSDKLTLAALEVTVRQHLEGVAQQEIPVARMIAASLDNLAARAQSWAQALTALGFSAEVESGMSAVGGGSLPGETLPTMLCAILQNERAPDAAALAASLRRATPPVIGRVLRDRLLLDPRTVLPDQDALLLRAVGESV